MTGALSEGPWSPWRWAACILVRPYDAEMARLAIREAASDDAHA